MLNRLLPEGIAVPECPVQTPGGTKVADVAWISEVRQAQAAPRAALTVATEICVEVVFPSNTTAELLAKGVLYFEAGAMEFWVCDEDSGMTFYSSAGKLERSAPCLEFPLLVEND